MNTAQEPELPNCCHALMAVLKRGIGADTSKRNWYEQLCVMFRDVMEKLHMLLVVILFAGTTLTGLWKIANIKTNKAIHFTLRFFWL
jgi:hypothetical protein